MALASAHSEPRASGLAAARGAGGACEGPWPPYGTLSEDDFLEDDLRFGRPRLPILKFASRTDGADRKLVPAVTQS